MIKIKTRKTRCRDWVILPTLMIGKVVTDDKDKTYNSLLVSFYWLKSIRLLFFLYGKSLIRQEKRGTLRPDLNRNTKNLFGKIIKAK